jgi:hypothetical protein
MALATTLPGGGMQPRDPPVAGMEPTRRMAQRVAVRRQSRAGWLQRGRANLPIWTREHFGPQLYA